MDWWIKLVYKYKLKHRADLDKVCIDMVGEKAVHYIFIEDVDMTYPSVQTFIHSLQETKWTAK